MDASIRITWDDLHAADGAVRSAALSTMLAVTEQPVVWAYEVWDTLVAALSHADNHQRAIVAQLLCSLAKSDPEQRILRDFDRLIALTHDTRFVTARHSLQALWKVWAVSPAHQELVLARLAARFQAAAAEKNGTLIRSDLGADAERAGAGDGPGTHRDRGRRHVSEEVRPGLADERNGCAVNVRHHLPARPLRARQHSIWKGAMTQADDPFTRHIERWKAEQALPWAQLKYRLVAANLDAHLPPGPLEILDAGGGNGAEALPFAQVGHRVTLVDSAAVMLDEARQAAEACGLSERITMIQHDLGALSALFPAPSFDVVICHNVLQYAPDVGQLLDTLLTTLRPGGVLSLVSVNRYSVPYQAAFLHHDLERAYASLDDHTQQATIFDAPMSLATAEEVSALLAARGFSAVHHFGIRCLCDYWGDNAEKMQPTVMAQLERLERRLTDAYPYKLLARYYQLIVHRTAP